MNLSTQFRGSVRCCWFVLFALICGFLLGAQPAMADQCSQPSVGPGTGVVGAANGADTCGVLITVNSVDGLGNATAVTLTPKGNGNPYDGTEDTIVGIQNNSSGNLSAITLSATAPIFGFDQDGPCDPFYNAHPYSWCTTAGFSGYEGPDNTFTNISADFTRGTVKFTSAVGSGGSTWFALEGTPNSLVAVTPTITAPPVPVTAGNDTTATFSYSNTQGSIVNDTLHFPSNTSFPNGETTVNVTGNDIILSNSRDWPPFVVGTPFAPSQLFVKNGDNAAAGNPALNDFGSMYEHACYVPPADPSTATEQQCPGFASNDPNSNDIIQATDTADLATPKPPIAGSTTCKTDVCTAAVIHFYPTQSPPETWSPSPSPGPNPACNSPLNGSPSSPPSGCDLNNLQNLTVTGDQTTLGGGGHKKGSYVSVYDVPMLETAIKVNGTPINMPGRQGTTAVTVPFTSPGSLEFTVYPAGCLNQTLVNGACPSIALGGTGGNNFFNPAPVALLNYAVTNSNSNTVASGTPSFSTTTVQPQDVVNNTTLNPGTYVAQWQSQDSVSITEQNIHQVMDGSISCDNMAASSTHPCYVTSPFTARFNVAYNFTGFFQPVDNAPAINTVKGGSAVPVKFSLGGNFGLNIFAPGYPQIGSGGSACSSTALQDAVETTVPASSNSLSYDPTSNQYNFVWKTPKTPGCFVLTLGFNDGVTTKSAIFLLK
jgi:hypothetical protein